MLARNNRKKEKRRENNKGTIDENDPIQKRIIELQMNLNKKIEKLEKEEEEDPDMPIE